MSKIDYDLTHIRAFVFDVDGVLSPSTVPIGDDGKPSRMVNVKDGYAMQLALKRGFKISVITGADTELMKKRFESLGVNDIFLRSSQKLGTLRRWITKNGLLPAEIAYVGDDIPDIECMQLVGLPIAPADASADAKAVAKYISPVMGGYGVARDVIEQVLRVQGHWLLDSTALYW